ncbi:diguanylate cyclase [Candidatus Izemoplasma sp. B36]|uniref:diguanylate cyclase n=1 Tax=Candidatus Izemoplasma sp. B36 TaxID=3242468 RepID=UPI003558AA21
MMNIRTTSALKVALTYLIFSSIWIFFSDWILSLFIDNVNSFKWISTVKGLAFIIISSWIIFSLVRKEIRKIEEVKKDVVTYKNYDQLTGLFNRDSFMEKIDEINKDKRVVSLVMTDLNGLKVINEIYGLSSGDNLLKRHSEVMKQVMPKNSFHARIGGDEFCSIIYDCKYEDAKHYSKALMERLEAYKVGDFQCSISIGVSGTNYEELNIYQSLTLAEDRMNKEKLLVEKSSSNSIILSLKTTLFERSDETQQHADRMALLCKQMAEKLNLSPSETSDIQLLAILHDIGKIGVSDEILLKPGKLNAHEYNQIKLHSKIGYRIASSINQLVSIAYDILCHHERWDGNGYPNKIKETEIPLNSRIVSIVDAYDAMTNDRVYRKAMSIEEALEEIARNRGTQFDPNLSDIFINLIKEESLI